MADNEPMGDARLAEIREYLDYPEVRYDEAMLMLRRLVPPVLDEVDRLSAALAKEQREHGNCENFHFRTSMAQSTVMVALAEQNKAMREIVEAVANARWSIYPSGEHLYGMGDATGLRRKARALLAAPEGEAK